MPSARDLKQERAELRTLDALYRQIQKAASEMIGFPASLLFDYSILLKFLKFHINNVGDPFSKRGYFRINTLDIEKRVIDRFAQLFHAPRGSYWGYVTNGGTEGNLYGLYLARELHPDGVVFFSDQTHYSTMKNLRLLQMPSVMVPSLSNGEIDYAALRNALVREGKKRTPILFANIGTTMKGAIDDVGRMREILSALKIKEHYIHCDAACFGMILPFLKDHRPPFDFRVKIDSMAISGHKVIGTPIPCGVILTKKSHAKKVDKFIEYVGVVDKTITGSRNGLSPLFLWHEMIFAAEEKFRKKINDCVDKADYAVRRFQEQGVAAWKNANSIIVVFPRPSEKIVRKWQLAVEGEVAHIITLPHVSRKILDRAIREISAEKKYR